MTEQFTEYRVHSLTNPDNQVGLVTGFACMSRKAYFTREELSVLEVALYEDDFGLKCRGEQRHEEEFVLQGKFNNEWLTIKTVTLLPGEGPEPDYGNCQDCGFELEESEFAVGVICSSCLEKEHGKREASTW